MRIVELLRLEKSSQGLIGILRIDGVVFCFTLEKDDTFLKQGCYHCKRFSGTKWPDTFEIVVPGHTAVLFHSLNVETETQGCVGIASTVGYLNGVRAIGVPVRPGDKFNSKVTFEKFMELLQGQNFFKLFVSNNFN